VEDTFSIKELVTIIVNEDYPIVQTLKVPTSLESSVSGLKLLIFNRTGYLPQYQKLVLNSEEMEDDKALKDYFTSESEVSLRVAEKSDAEKLHWDPTEKTFNQIHFCTKQKAARIMKSDGETQDGIEDMEVDEKTKTKEAETTHTDPSDDSHKSPNKLSKEDSDDQDNKEKDKKNDKAKKKSKSKEDENEQEEEDTPEKKKKKKSKEKESDEKKDKETEKKNKIKKEKEEEEKVTEKGDAAEVDGSGDKPIEAEPDRIVSTQEWQKNKSANKQKKRKISKGKKRKNPFQPLPVKNVASLRT